MKHTDLIKDKLNILDVVGSYVKLEKAGKTYKGKSPFTNEKTPSFFVSPEKGFFYCFSSQKGGDMFTFIQEVERIDFRAALKLLAEKAGISLDEELLESTNAHARSYKLLDDACRWYEVQLRKNKDIVDYLLERGLSKETMVQFRIGFVPEGWHQLYAYLTAKKYSEQEMEEVGLITKKDNGSYYDRFRSRIMFPLFDAQGRVVGFSGRIVAGSDQEQKAAKYLNSPEGPLFKKSELLFGYNFAKHEIRNRDFCLVVEGQFDVILCQQFGYPNTVALSGTGLSDFQLGLVKRFSDTLVLALDSDAAGMKATRKSVLSAYRLGMNVQVVALEKGKDPADTLKESKEKFDVLVLDAKDYFDYRIEYPDNKDMSFEEKKKLTEQDLFPFVYLTQSAIVQDRMLQKLSLFLGVSVESVREDFANYVPQDDVHEGVLSTESQTQESPAPRAASQSTQGHILHLANFVHEQGYQYSSEDIQKIETLYHDMYGSSFATDLQELDEIEKNIQLFVHQQQYQDMSSVFLKTAVFQALVEERVRMIDKESSELLEKIRIAESQKDSEQAEKLTQENSNLKILKNSLLEQLEM